MVPAAEDNEVVHVTVTNRLIRAEAGYLVAKTVRPAVRHARSILVTP